jgi:histone deacetylase complex regulatory component SIN3
MLTLDRRTRFAAVGLKFIMAESKYDSTSKSFPLETAIASTSNIPKRDACRNNELQKSLSCSKTRYHRAQTCTYHKTLCVNIIVRATLTLDTLLSPLRCWRRIQQACCTAKCKRHAQLALCSATTAECTQRCRAPATLQTSFPCYPVPNRTLCLQARS